MMNWEGSERKWPRSDVIFQHLLGGPVKNHDKCQDSQCSGQDPKKYLSNTSGDQPSGSLLLLKK
jgi:hypothetical protein